MKKIFLIISVSISIFSCQNNTHSNAAITDPNVHSVVALEKVNTSQYTYLLVNENGIEQWLALPLTEVKVGDTYYYVNGMLMNNFVSKELGRTFEKVYFLQELFTEPPTKVSSMGVNLNSNPKPLPANHPSISKQNELSASESVQQNPDMHKGVALEKINTSSYTYLLLNENGVKNWLAFPLTEVKIGETYFYTNEMLMTNFESKELKRTFEKIFFVPGVTVQSDLKQKGSSSGESKMRSMPSSDMKSNGSTIVVEKQAIKIDPVKNGISISEIFSMKDKLEGKRITVRGKVTKFKNGIMYRNWVHLQDGTESNGKYDLTITTQDIVTVGEIETFEGTVSVNKDFGAGYRYDVIIEGAIVKRK